MIETNTNLTKGGCLMSNKPTIHELESILEEEDSKIEILPNGQVRTVSIIPEHAQIRVMKALRMAYEKHVRGDESIGGEELCDTLTDALCEAMGEEGFNDWRELMKEAGAVAEQNQRER